MNDEISLKNLFKKASSSLNSLESSPLSHTDDEFQKQLEETVSMLEKCKNLIDSLAIFSVNETVDDINSADLALILTNSHLGQATSMKTKPDRETILQEAQNHYTKFLDTCMTHELLSKQDLTLWEQVRKGEKARDPARMREEKIARYKRQKATMAKLEDLMALGEDDDLQREATLTSIDLAIQKSIEALANIKEEMHLLQQVKKMKEEGELDLQHGMKERDRARGPVTNGPLMTKEGKPLRNFVIVNNRQRLHEAVFGPDHALPTMSIEEYLDREAQRGNVLSGGDTSRTGQVGDKPEKPDLDGDEEAEAAELKKQREWDDWKDDHRRGEGNRLRHG